VFVSIETVFVKRILGKLILVLVIPVAHPVPLLDKSLALVATDLTTV
jgi:hypothetical protein